MKATVPAEGGKKQFGELFLGRALQKRIAPFLYTTDTQLDEADKSPFFTNRYRFTMAGIRGRDR